MFSVSAGVETQKAPLAIRVILKELNKIKKTRVTDDELRRAKDFFWGQFSMGLEDTLDRMSWIGERVLYGEDVPRPEAIRQEMERVSPEDIREVADHIFRHNHLNMALIGPLSEKSKAAIQKEFVLD